MKIKSLTLLTSVFVLVSSFAHAGLYRWVDDKGEVHFSDKVPAAASKKAHSKISKNGVIEKELDPESKKIKEMELRLAKEKKEEATRVAKLDWEKHAKARRRDNYLLSTYENKNELMTSFESKIKMLKGNSTILSAHNQILKKKIKTLQNQTNRDKNIELKIVNIAQTIEQYKKALDDNNQELISLKENYETDLIRYIELTH